MAQGIKKYKHRLIQAYSEHAHLRVNQDYCEHAYYSRLIQDCCEHAWLRTWAQIGPKPEPGPSRARAGRLSSFGMLLLDMQGGTEIHGGAT